MECEFLYLEYMRRYRATEELAGQSLAIVCLPRRRCIVVDILQPHNTDNIYAGTYLTSQETRFKEYTRGVVVCSYIIARRLLTRIFVVYVNR